MTRKIKHETRFGVLRVPETITVSIMAAQTSLAEFLETEYMAENGVLALSSFVSQDTNKETIKVYVDFKKGQKPDKIPETWQGYDVSVKNMRNWRKA